MKRPEIRRTIQAWRPPTVQRVIDAPATHSAASPVVSLGVGRSIDEALQRMSAIPVSTTEGRTLLIPDLRKFDQPGRRYTFVAAYWIARRHAVTIALPEAIPDINRLRWAALADEAGAKLTLLGSAGWNRFDFGDRSVILKSADVPVELHAEGSIVALSAPSGAGCLGLWNSIVHPNTALRARLSPYAGVELSASVDAHYLLVGKIESSWVAAWATRAIAAELVARAIERLRERLGGIESPGPWEDAGVQHLSGIGENGLYAANLVLEARLGNNAGEALARRLSEMLGWQLEITRDDNGGGEHDQG